MPFHYLIKPGAPGSNNPFSARANPQETVEADEFLADIATRAGAERAAVEKVLRALFDSIIGFGRESRPVAATLELFRVIPVAGGSYATASPDDNAIRKTCGFSLQPLPAVRAAFQEGLALEKDGQVGVIVPVLDSVAAMPGKQANKYHPGGGLEIRGSHLRSSNPDETPSATLTNPDGSSPVTLLVLDASNRRATVAVPAGALTGAKILKYSDGEHTVQYATQLTPI